jgi:hypothetical protein
MRCEVDCEWLVGKNLEGHACDLLQDTMLPLLENIKYILTIASNKLRLKSALTVESKGYNFAFIEA